MGCYCEGHPCSPFPTMPAGCSFVFFLQTVLLGLLEDVPVDVWKGLWFQNDRAQPHCGKCLGVVGRDVPREVDWAWRAHCMASSVTWSHPIGSLPVETLEGTCVCSLSHEYRSHNETSCCCYNCQCQHVAACTGKYHVRHCHLPWIPVVIIWGTLS
jgi:hypothetical protein